MHRRTLLIAALAPLLGACTGLKRKDQATRLDTALTGYAGAIRWGSFETAQAFARPRTTAARPLDPELLSGLKVTGYTIRINRVNDAGDEANVSMSFTYYFQDQGRVSRVVQSADWYFDAELGAWLLDGELPRFSR